MCCFEFKGPTLVLSGITTIEEEEENIVENGERKAGVGEKVEMDSSSIHRDLPNNGNAEAHHEGDTNETDDIDGIYKQGFSASMVASKFSYLFSKLDHLDSSQKKYAPQRRVIYPVAQAICQATLSKTGCAFLYNHQTGIAFKVHRIVEGKIVVFVTGVIGCSQTPGNVAAMFGFADYCV